MGGGNSIIVKNNNYKDLILSSYSIHFGTKTNQPQSTLKHVQKNYIYMDGFLNILNDNT